MTGILEKIVCQKRLEVQELKSRISLASIQSGTDLSREAISMKRAILTGSGLIAEFKRASPSKGLIRANADPGIITMGYVGAGASAISILTDHDFFKADDDDIIKARNLAVPILRKEFIIDEYQIYQTKALGADCMLLIAAILTKNEIGRFIEIANTIGLETIVEIHNKDEMDKLTGQETIVGVNNRNLETFNVSIETSLSLASELGEVVKISESGLGLGSNLKDLVDAGYDGFLVGESFMRENDPADACKKFVNNIILAKS